MIGGNGRVDANLILGPWITPDQPDWAPVDVVAHLDRIGAEFGVVRHSHALIHDPVQGNRRLLEEIAGHTRLQPAFVLGPLATDEYGAAIVDTLREAAVRSIWVYPRLHGWHLAGPASGSLFSLLNELQLPLFVDLDQTNWTELTAVAAGWPDLSVVACGLGYRTSREALAVLDAHSNIRVDTSVLSSAGGLELLTRRYGADRLVPGSGAPIRDATAPWFLTSRLDPTVGEAANPGPARTDWSGSIIDVHAHLGAWPTSWMPLQEAADLVRLMDLSGTTHSVLSHCDAIFGDLRRGNEAALAAAEAYPERLSVHLVANPHREQDLDLLDAQLARPEVAGIKIHPFVHECPVDDERYDWVWELARRHRVPVLAHGFGEDPTSDPLLFARPADAYPDVDILVGHSGATYEGIRRTIQVARGRRNLYAETCGSWMTGWWLGRLVAALGADRVMHGTDAVLIEPRLAVGRVLGAELSDADRALVLAGNARRVLRLAPGRVPEPVSTRQPR